MNKINARKKKGFTLIELIIVIAIIAILAAIAIPKFATVRHNANVTTDIANAKNIHSIVAQGIANEKVTTSSLNASGTDIASKVGGYDVAANLDAGGTASKVDNTNFYVAMDTSGDIIIYAGTKSSTMSADKVTPVNEVYPKQGKDFEKK